VDKSLPGARRPVRSWGIEAPRNSLKTPVNSQIFSQSQRPGFPAAQDAQRAQLPNSETPVNKLRFLPFLFSTHQVYAPGAPGKFLCNLRNKIPVFCEKNFEMHLDMLPGEGIYTRPGYKRES
jgi:hypothetical protein